MGRFEAWKMMTCDQKHEAFWHGVSVWYISPVDSSDTEKATEK